MLTEAQLEQQCLDRFQETGWDAVFGSNCVLSWTAYSAVEPQQRPKPRRTKGLAGRRLQLIQARTLPCPIMRPKTSCFPRVVFLGANHGAPYFRCSQCSRARLRTGNGPKECALKESRKTVGDYGSLVRGTTYKGDSGFPFAQGQVSSLQ
jgi:hypothetical protein